MGSNYIRKTKDVNISPKLITILEKISSKSEIAKMLLRTKLSKDDLVDDPIDYLSISKEDPTKISYLSSEKIEKTGSTDPEELWASKSRIVAKPAVAIKKFLRNVNEKDLDIFTSLFKATVSNKDFTLRVVTGEDIKKYYGYRSYNSEINGTLHNSCMKHDNCADFFQVYIDNADICKMLVMLDQKERLMGRALLWNAIDTETGKDILVMDRIYAVDDNKNMHYFKEWAEENDYIYKKEQRWQNCLHFESHGKSKIYKIAVKIKKKPYLKYPYVDTFKFWNEKESTFSNFLPEKDNGYIRTLIGNDGKTFGADVLALDVVQKMYMHREHLVYLPYLDGRTHADYTIWSETMETSIAKDHAVYNEEIKDYMFNSEYDKFNNQTRLNARKEQIRKINERNAQKMVSSKKARLSHSELYEQYMAQVTGAVFNGQIFGQEEPAAPAPARNAEAAQPVAQPIINGGVAVGGYGGGYIAGDIYMPYGDINAAPNPYQYNPVAYDNPVVVNNNNSGVYTVAVDPIYAPIRENHVVEGGTVNMNAGALTINGNPTVATGTTILETEMRTGGVNANNDQAFEDIINEMEIRVDRQGEQHGIDAASQLGRQLNEYINRHRMRER